MASKEIFSALLKNLNNFLAIHFWYVTPCHNNWQWQSCHSLFYFIIFMHPSLRHLDSIQRLNVIMHQIKLSTVENTNCYHQHNTPACSTTTTKPQISEHAEVQGPKIRTKPRRCIFLHVWDGSTWNQVLNERCLNAKDPTRLFFWRRLPPNLHFPLS